MSKRIVFVYPDGTLVYPKKIIDDDDENLQYDDRKNLPTLYTVDSRDKTRMWKAWVIGSTVYRMHGLVDGKKVESERTFKGKSLGNKNETTPEEQAWAEANKYWIKQLDKEYLPDKKDEAGQNLLVKVKKSKDETGGHNINAVASIGGRAKKNITRPKTKTRMVSRVKGGAVIPMKAIVWELEDENDPNSVKYKVAKYFSKLGPKPKGKPKPLIYGEQKFFCQPKLDGWRARIMLQNSDDDVMTTEVVITSNSGKQYPWFAKLRKNIHEWLLWENNDGIDVNLLDGLDGELYAEKLYKSDGSYIPEKSKFSTIMSINGLSRSKPHELEDQMQFHCFDLMDKSGTIPQWKRFEMLDSLFKKLPKHLETRIVRVQTDVMSDIRKIPVYHDKIAAKGYEGVIIRAYDMKYKAGKRNGEMRKYKHVIDEEYKVTGARVDDGVAEHYFVWVCKTKDDKEFTVKQIGSHEEACDTYKKRADYFGRLLTVKFQELSEDGVPRFPIAKGFRDSGDI